MTSRTARRRVLRVTVPAGPDDQAAADARADLLAVDMHQFRDLVGQARVAGDDRQARGLLDPALVNGDTVLLAYE